MWVQHTHKSWANTNKNIFTIKIGANPKCSLCQMRISTPEQQLDGQIHMVADWAMQWRGVFGFQRGYRHTLGKQPHIPRAYFCHAVRVAQFDKEVENLKHPTLGSGNVFFFFFIFC